MSQPGRKSAWREYAEAIAVALVLALFIRTFIIQAFKIPSGSMIPTLLVGDHLLVNKFIFRFREPERDDVLVFKYPRDRKTDFIKRLIGLPGETVELREGALFIDGRPTPDPHAAYGLDGGTGQRKNFGPFTVPAEGYVITSSGDDLDLYLNVIANETGKPVFASGGKLYLEGRPVESYKVRSDYLFMMGDNRDNSLDSRYWGPVSEKAVVGKAMVIYWYWGGDLLENARWKRIGTVIK